MATKSRAELMKENRIKLIAAARKAFAEKGSQAHQWMSLLPAWA